MNWLLLVFAFMWQSPTQAKPPNLPNTYEKITLRVGEQRRMHVPGTTRIMVSRRGIIHLLEEDPENCHITGMRTGVVVVNFTRRFGEKKTLYVEVLPREVLKPALSTLKDSTDKASSSKRAFKVNAHVELLETQSMESIGKRGETSLGIDLISSQIAPTANHSLESNSESVERTVMAKPSFLILEDEDGVVKSGGETIHEKVNEEGRTQTVWHEFGMALSIKVQGTKTSDVNASILFVLKAPSGTPERYSLNQIQTKTVLRPGKKTLIGTVDLASGDHSGSEDLFLSKVPIIGPLFKYTASSAAKALVQLWMEIKESK